MRLLHVSDIHFRSPDCNDPDHDPERPYRTKLMQDARNLAAHDGQAVQAILVGGDIAYRGAAAEYDAALAWLEELAKECGCPMERVFVIPGNHDVDRSIITSTPSVRNVQKAIADAAPQKRERELRTQFQDEDAGRALFAPIAAYNAFASRFGCQVYPGRLYWKQNLPLEDGVTLRVHGLTSTLLSGAGGQDDTRESLYLSPLQTVLDPIDNVVNLVMSHHPPDWFMDHDDVDDAVRGRAAIHLFGHKHRQRIYKDDGYVRFAAGAVNPDRQETGWQPGYNLIDVNVAGVGASRIVTVNARLQQWQSNPDLFRPMLTTAGDTVFRHQIDFPAFVAARAAAPAAAPAPLPPAPADTDVEATMSDEPTRNLIFRFWNLTVSQRRDIALRHALISQDELVLPEPQRYGLALQRAKERGLLEKIAADVAALEK